MTGQSGAAVSTSLADTGIKFTDIVGKLANIALNVGRGAEAVDGIIGPVAGFIPYYSQAMAVIRIADPILAKVVAAAPAVSAGIETGRPIIDAAQAAAPNVLPHIKQLLAIAINHDPAQPDAKVTADDITDADAKGFMGPVLFGRRWTFEEEQRWMDRVGAEGFS